MHEKSGLVASRHETFEDAEKSVHELNARIEAGAGVGYGCETVIIESSNDLQSNAVVNPGDY
jgi:hypothetical protein